MLKFKYFLLIIVLFISGCEGKPTIHLYGGSWESIWVVNSIGKFIIEKGYGYPVKVLYETDPVMRGALENGKLDLTLEMWHQNNFKWYNNQIKKGTIVKLGKIYDESPQFWVIPKWVAEKYNIETVYDMKIHWKLFTNSEHPYKGVFYNSPVGWTCSDINIIKLKAYGLYKYFDIVTPASTLVLESVLNKSQKMQQPVFGYSWTPGSMDEYDWHVLKEPAYSDACWNEIYDALDDDSKLPAVKGCAYYDQSIFKVARKSFLKKAPDLVFMLNNMFLDIETLDALEKWGRINRQGDWSKVAIYFLKNYEHVWSSWVSEEASAKLLKELK